MTQKEALEILKTGASVFLTGEPGAGKTHVVNAYVAHLRSCGIEAAITASTGIAATHIGGMTIHSWSGIGVANRLSPEEVIMIAGRKRIRKRLVGARALIIDEVSMLSGATLSMADAVCRAGRESALPFGGMQVVLVGDFFQLPPVSREGNGTVFAYKSDSWRALNLAVCYLAEQYRQDDPEYLAVLSAIRSNRFDAADRAHLFGQRFASGDLPDDVPKLFTHNVDVDRINAERLARLPGKPVPFYMEAFGPALLVAGLKRNCLSPELLELKTGATVMCTKNNPKKGFVNGTLGKVNGFDAENGYPVVDTREGPRILVEPMEWTIEEHRKIKARVAQIPLRLAWAMTVHKSQGMSMDAAVVDLSDAFEYGQGYVALSRVRRLSGLYLIGANDRAFMVDREILEKDREFRLASDTALERLRTLSGEELGAKHERFIQRCGGKLSKAEDAVPVRQGASAASVRSGLDRVRALHPNAYRKWSPEDDTELRDLFAQKTATAQLAKHFGRKPGAVFARLAKLDLIAFNPDTGRYEVKRGTAAGES